jgi:hypothetical protein
MTVMRLSQFLGANKQINPRLLAPGLGVNSWNQKPGRGDFRPWRETLQQATVSPGSQTIYRMGRDVRDPTRYWLAWPQVVYAVRSPDATDTTERTYFAGVGITPQVTDNTMALIAPPYPSTSRPMSLPPPASPPLIETATPGDDSALMETYFYVFTYVNDWGWESAPSPVSNELDQYTNGTIKVSQFASPPAGNYHINRIRLYRTQASSNTSDFFYVTELPWPATSFIDDKTSIGEVLPTATWNPTPDNLDCLTAMWNGMMAGISGQGIRFCEPYIPYAWPVQFEITAPDATPVGLGVFAQNLLVLTTAKPLIVAGSTPDAMDQRVLDIPQACVAKRSIVSLGSGVAWASDDGLCYFGVDGAKILTAGIMMREDWQKLNPATIIGSMFEGLYFGSYETVVGSGIREGFFINPNDQSTGIYFTKVGYPAMAFDQLMDHLFVLIGNNVHMWDVAPNYMLAEFQTGITRMPKPTTSFAIVETVADGFPFTVQLFADGVLRHEQVVNKNEPYRMKGGYIGQDFYAVVNSAFPVAQIAFSHSIEEAASV